SPTWNSPTWNSPTWNSPTWNSPTRHGCRWSGKDLKLAHGLAKTLCPKCLGQHRAQSGLKQLGCGGLVFNQLQFDLGTQAVHLQCEVLSGLERDGGPHAERIAGDIELGFTHGAAAASGDHGGGDLLTDLKLTE
ncbi:MAG: hypothetical protein ACP5DC_04110, partial [Halothiobacillaceae bacterium]